jgi:arylformamidase
VSPDVQPPKGPPVWMSMDQREIVAYGTRETPEFQRQGLDLAAAVEATGKPVSLIVAEGYNHFEILETLASPYGLLGRAALAQMGLGPD